MRNNVRIHVILTLLLLALPIVPLEAWGRIKLITLPIRERVEIQLDHPQATLVEEERIVPLVKGINQVDFSWANTRISPDSLIFRVLNDPDSPDQAVKVLSVSYPPNENSLVWAVSSTHSGSAQVRISYILDGLEKEFHYRATATHDEKKLNLAQYLRLKNLANEEYKESSISVGFGDQLTRSVGIDETKDLLVARYPEVVVRKTYTADLAQYGYLDTAKKKLKIPMHYVLKNDTANGLGKASLPFGKTRIFQEDGHGGTAFVGEDWGKFTPRDDEMSLYLGVARDIVVKRTIARKERKRINGNLYNYDLIVKYEIENFKESPVTLDIGETLRGLRAELGYQNQRDVQWELGPETTLLGKPDGEKSDADHLLFHVDLPAKKPESKPDKQICKLHILMKNEW
ncbi:MAG: hypothetical protein SD837_20100 [Candidatus Electrothrix scaldis]|nr:MAG: hypothetical protein SD837_20100 [Candidatus Electrothrix sp. GW3-3]